MDTQTIVILIIAIVAIVVAVLLYARLRRVEHLKRKFGPEYERVAHEIGDRRRAEKILETREKRVASYSLRHLTPGESARVVAEWRTVQEHFVDDPGRAVGEADRLINQALHTTGYPVEDSNFDQRAADLSVEHAHIVDHYRQAHEIASSSRPTTENLRSAMQHYRAVMEDIVDPRSPEHEEVKK